MSPTTQGAIVLIVTLAVLLSGAPVAFGLGAIALSFLVIFQGVDALRVAAETFYSGLHDFTLVSIPMFVMMGAAIGSSPAGKDLYEALDRWLYRVPGGLVISNLGACAIFAALTGSSPACCAAIGKMGIPEMRRRGYPDDVATGSICAGGTLGILIPPSINMIVYGAMTGTSVGRLYAAGIIPGLLLTALFVLVVIVMCWINPAYAGAKDPTAALAIRLRRLVDLFPPLLIFVLVMGTIYFGWATPTEAAAVGVLVALVLAAAFRTLSFRMLHECFVVTISVSAMIMLIAVSAFYLNFVLGLMGVPQAMAEFVGGLGTTPNQLLVVLTILYLILGCFMDALAMVIGTIPIVMPLVIALKIDPVWFGIYLVLMAELALITPPVGMNLYVVQGIRKEGSISDVIIGVLPFLFMMLLLVALLWAWPDIALWLPRMSFG